MEHGDELVEGAVGLAGRWLAEARRSATRAERRAARRLARMLASRDGMRFAMDFTDRVVRSPTPGVAAAQLHDLVARRGAPRFLSPADRVLLAAGGALAPVVPRVVVPLARARLRALVGDLVAPADDPALARHLEAVRAWGATANVNPLGEAVLGEVEAVRRRDLAVAALARPDVDYVSVKVSSVASQLPAWDLDAATARVVDRLLPLYLAAATSDPPGFVNLDMEELRDLDLTVAVFRRLLADERLGRLDAGIVLQAYLPESHDRLAELLDLATARHRAGGGTVVVRLVKGANLAMERVDAELHGWPRAPYPSKADTDASYLRLLDDALRPDRLVGARIGVASHNLFAVAWAHLLADARGVHDRVRFEMLHGMAPPQSRAVLATTGNLRLYTPVVAADDLPAAIAYLFRRLEENATPDDFLHRLGELAPGTPAFTAERDRFVAAVAHRRDVARAPRRTQDRRVPAPAVPAGAHFANEPDTDPSRAANRAWAAEVVAAWRAPALPPPVDAPAAVDEVVDRARSGATRWGATPARERRAALARAADGLARRRGDLVATMCHETSKTVAEGDPEVSEAVDLARAYAADAVALDDWPGLAHDPLGVVVVVPPWNFPVAIPAGGVLAALAAGNSVVLKPAPESPACALLVAEACWEAGVPTDVLQYVRVPDGDLGRHLVTHPGVDAVVLTGSLETALRFAEWRPDLRLFAETSGKNAIVVSARADVDQAVADVVRSAFGHAGQKCSAASLVIVEAPLHDHPAFLRQLADATRSLAVGPATDLATTVGPLVGPPGEALTRALTTLEPGERWLVAPERRSDDGRLWRPGVRVGVRPGSWFHRTECFGPVLGVMRAADLDEAVAWQNDVAFGLTGGIWSLDPGEVDRWLEQVEVGNAYVNRHTTGAIVHRQPFGGWKRSVVGPGAKAGGLHAVGQLVRWRDDGPPAPLAPPGGAATAVLDAVSPHVDAATRRWLRAAAGSDEHHWTAELAPRELAGLAAEANVARHRPLPRGLLLRAGDGATAPAVARVLLAAARAGVAVTGSLAPSAAPLGALLAAAGTPAVVEADGDLAGRAGDVDGRVDRVRLLGSADLALRRALARAGLAPVDATPVAHGRVELLTVVREQAVSRTRHRHGTVLAD